MPESFRQEDTYDGSATIGDIEVEVQLRGRVDPIDGKFHWHGRIHPSPALMEAHRSGDTVQLRTEEGEAEGRLSDIDTWNRFRIAGTGTPPFSRSAWV